MTRIIASPDVIVREIDGQSVILDLKTSRYLSLNEVGTRMWNVLLSSESVEAARSSLVREYEIEPQQLESDLHEFVEQLVAHGLIAIEGERRPV